MLIEYFIGSRQERGVLQERDHLRYRRPNLSRQDRYKLEDLEEEMSTITRRLFWRKVGAVGVVLATGTTLGAVVTHAVQQQVPDLGLKIDEAGFWTAVNAGPQIGVITQTTDKKSMDCLKPLGDFCVAESSPNFKVAINRPMADFIFQQSNLTNPSLPTRMIIVEDWLGQARGEHTAAFTAIADDRSDQIIVISLKEASYQAFLDLDRKRLPLADYFNGAVSYFVSKYVAWHAADAGSRTKKLLKPGMSLIDDDLLKKTKPQIEAFSQRYTSLFNQALTRGLDERALILVANLEATTNLQAYRTQMLQEA